MSPFNQAELRSAAPAKAGAYRGRFAVIVGVYCGEIGKRSRKIPLSIHDLH